MIEKFRRIGWGQDAPVKLPGEKLGIESDVRFTLLKTMDYCPLVSLISGIYEFVMVNEMRKSGYAQDHLLDTVMLTLRGVLAVVQLGSVLFPG